MTQKTPRDCHIAILLNDAGQELKFLIRYAIVYNDKRYMLLVDLTNQSPSIDETIVWRMAIKPYRVDRKLVIGTDIYQVTKVSEVRTVRYAAMRHYGDQTDKSQNDKLAWICEEAMYHSDLPEN